jgi:hypothetical protein
MGTITSMVRFAPSTLYGVVQMNLLTSAYTSSEN